MLMLGLEIREQTWIIVAPVKYSVQIREGVRSFARHLILRELVETPKRGGLRP
mgnify:CR=1 FL=1